MNITGQMIADLREDKGYKQKEFAHLLNVSPGCLSKYETGRSEPSLEMLVKMADLLGTSVDYLLGRNALRMNYNELKKIYAKNVTGFDVLNDMLSLDVSHRKQLVELLVSLKCHSDFIKISSKMK